MWPLLSLALVAASPQTLRVGERVPMPLVLVSPRDTFQSATRSELLRRISDRVEAETDLILVEVPAVTVEACADPSRGRFACLVQAARRDRQADLVLIVSTDRHEGVDRITAVLMDLEIAGPIVDGFEGADDVETRIRGEAFIARHPPAHVDGADAVPAAVDVLIDGLRAPLDARGHWRPFGAVEIDLPLDDFQVLVDDTPVDGLGHRPTTRLEQLKPGRRRLRLEHVEFHPAEGEVDIRRGEVVTWTPHLELRAGEGSTIESVIRYGGGALAAGGVALSIVMALAASGTEYTCVSFTLEPPTCSGTRGATIGMDVDVFGSPSSRWGVPAIAPGIGVASAGLGMLTANLLRDPRHRAPWLDIAIGAASGALGFLLTWVVNGALLAGQTPPPL